jgi:hypothetical protein
MLLDRLPKSYIRALAKSDHVKTPIQQAARESHPLEGAGSLGQELDCSECIRLPRPACSSVN